MKHQKSIAVFLVLTLVCSLFVACSNEAKDETINGEGIDKIDKKVTEEILSVYLDTPWETIYAQMEQGLLTHAELLKYDEVQKDIVKDVNQLLNDYRADIYPIKDVTGPRSVFREAPFPDGCTIPSNIEWENLQIAIVDPDINQYDYAIVITLEDHYNMYIEAGYTGYTFDSGETIRKIWLWNVKFFYGDFDDCNNLRLFSPYTAICVHEKEFEEFSNNTINRYRPDETYEYNEEFDILHTDSEIAFPVKFSNGEQAVFTFRILREDGIEAYELIKVE